MRFARLLASAALALLAALAASCTTATAACDCADPDLTLAIPQDIAPSVVSVTLTGAACAGVQPTCTNTTAGCVAYRFAATAAGGCHVEVDFASAAPFTADLTIAQGTGCCSGFYASPPSAAQIDVPETGDGGG